MTNSPPSASEIADAFGLLHPEVRRWVRDQGWPSLREVQVQAILALLRGQGDVLISAATAAGKTEAAFLPVLSEVAEAGSPGLRILYVAPLKALINDQCARLEGLFARLDLPLVKWHGDAPPGPKQRLAARPAGAAFITPESIEALFCRRPAVAHALFSSLRFIVIDELHAFMNGPRGLHLASLLRRIEALSCGSARRIGLSATLGDAQRARAWLRPANPGQVSVLSPTGSDREMRLQLRGIIDPAEASDEAPAALPAVAEHLMGTLRGHNALVFGGSRQRVEVLADLLRGRCETENLPNEFFPHHGNLSKELREELEGRLRAGRLPTTAVCTSTLELGIDIGSVEAVAQVGAPRSLSSLRQRLGRAGRREGKPAVLRVYVIEPELQRDPSPLDTIRQETIRAVAAIHLLGEGFVETPAVPEGLASALLHQTLSVICERGGIRAASLHALLCGPGPFAHVPPALLMALLRSMGRAETALIEQSPDGTLMLGRAGEKLTAGRDFYALFASPQEWRVISKGKPLGTLPRINPVAPGNLIVFAGRRWIVREVDDAELTITVAPHSGGKAPNFDNTGVEPVDDRLVASMLDVYLDDRTPEWLDAPMKALLAGGRQAFRQLGLDSRRVVQAGHEVHLFTWRGSRSNQLLAVLLGAEGFNCWAHDIGVSVTNPEMAQLAAALARLQSSGMPELERAGAEIGGIASGKFDHLIAPEVLRAFWLLSMQEAASGFGDMVGQLRLPAPA